MRHHNNYLYGSIWLMLLTACALAQAGDPAGPAADDSPAAKLAGLEQGWNVMEPGDDTVCSDGSTYRFFVRPGNPKKLVVYFQGGGACWMGRNCDEHLDPSYKVAVAGDEMERYRGIFEFGNEENPFADYSFVVAPYCTADVHLGDNVATYEAPAREADEDNDPHEAHEVTIHHKGIVNARAVLDWTYAHFLAPAEIFVTGSSAGLQVAGGRQHNYSDSVSPEPPISDGTSFIFGSPSLIGRTDSW